MSRFEATDQIERKNRGEGGFGPGVSGSSKSLPAFPFASFFHKILMGWNQYGWKHLFLNHDHPQRYLRKLHYVSRADDLGATRVFPAEENIGARQIQVYYYKKIVGGGGWRGREGIGTKREIRATGQAITQEGITPSYPNSQPPAISHPATTGGRCPALPPPLYKLHPLTDSFGMLMSSSGAMIYRSFKQQRPAETSYFILIEELTAVGQDVRLVPNSASGTKKNLRKITWITYSSE